MHDHPTAAHIIEEQTFLFLTARWNDDIIQWLSCLVHEENVVKKIICTARVQVATDMTEEIVSKVIASVKDK